MSATMAEDADVDSQSLVMTADTNIAQDSSSYLLNWIETKLRLPPLQSTREGYLYLPDTAQSTDDESDTADNRLSMIQLDNYLATLPPLVLTTRQLLFDNNDCRNKSIGIRRNEIDDSKRSPPQHRLISSSNSGRVINVLQGEIAHCTPSQADILVSDDATTCHIVAIWSRHFGSESKEGTKSTSLDSCSLFATMAHIDGPGYGGCIKKAVNEHVKHHFAKLRDSGKSTGIRSLGIIGMSVHIMGGFNDHDRSSITITNDVLQTLAAVSRDHEDNCFRLQITLETCAVASANDDGTGCPLGRGLAMDVATGKIFLAEVDDVELVSSYYPTTTSCDRMVTFDHELPRTIAKDCISSARGPAFTLRSIRIWASAFHSSNRKRVRKLSIIHHPIEDSLIIESFFFAPHYSLKRLLECNDTVLLRQTSTSPEVEKTNFASRVRESFMFMNQNSSSKVFQHGKPIKYNRVGLNGWVRSD